MNYGKLISVVFYTWEYMKREKREKVGMQQTNQRSGLIHKIEGASLVRAIRDGLSNMIPVLLVLAEFVETNEQKEALHEMGCDCYQGYLYSPAFFLDDPRQTR